MKYLLPLLLLALSLGSCKSDNVKQDSAIDAKLRQTIAQKNDSLIEGLSTGDRIIFEQLATEDFVKTIQAQINGLYWLRRGNRINQENTVYTEYEVTGKDKFSMVELTDEEKGYLIRYTSPEKDTYVSIIKIDLGQGDAAGLGAIYGLVNGQWKLCEVDAFIIESRGETPKAIYEQAVKSEKGGFDIDAAYHAKAATQLADANNERFFKFTDVKKIQLYSTTLENRMGEDYIFPYELKDIKTKPVIKGLLCNRKKEGMQYRISYATTIPVMDYGALEPEYKEVKKSVQEHYKGIDFSKAKVYYRALNMDGDEIVNGYEFDEE